MWCLTLSLFGNDTRLPVWITETSGTNLRPRCSISAGLSGLGRAAAPSGSAVTTTSASGLPLLSLTCTVSAAALAAALENAIPARLIRRSNVFMGAHPMWAIIPPTDGTGASLL